MSALLEKTVQSFVNSMSVEELKTLAYDQYYDYYYELSMEQLQEVLNGTETECQQQ